MGGGNNYLIRTPSLNEHENILYNSDLNGSITIGNDSTWNNIGPIFCWNQDNKTNTGYIRREPNRFGEGYYKNKAWDADYYNNAYGGYRPVIEYRDI